MLGVPGSCSSLPVSGVRAEVVVARPVSEGSGKGRKRGQAGSSGVNSSGVKRGQAGSSRFKPGRTGAKGWEKGRERVGKGWERVGKGWERFASGVGRGQSGVKQG